jgi:hypothetical protein
MDRRSADLISTIDPFSKTSQSKDFGMAEPRPSFKSSIKSMRCFATRLAQSYLQTVIISNFSLLEGVKPIQNT